jgi:negative regulator of replication initiation
MGRDAFAEAAGQLASQRRAVEDLLADLNNREQQAEAREWEIRALEDEMAELRDQLASATWQQKRRAVERFVREVRVTVADDGKPAVQAVYAFKKHPDGALASPSP